MKEVEVLIKLIIPAILLIFWALSHLFNREGAGTSAKGTPPFGPRPTGYPGPRPADRARPGAAPTRPGLPSRDDDVLVIRSETSRPPGRSNPQPKRNPARGRAPQASPSRRPEALAASPREQLGGRISADVNQTITHQLDVRPLSESTAALVNETSPSVPTMAAGLTPPSTILDLRAALATQGRIREALLLNEILRAPVALRGRRR